MTEKRFITNGYYIYDQFKEDSWLVNEVEAQEIVNIMNNLDTKARERSKALSKLQKENEQLKQQLLCDDVCGICKHEYLAPSGGYFIAKCKKGHKECSKEDIKYCEDFERS